MAKTDKDILKKAHKHIESWFTYFSENIWEAKNTIRFVLQEQWSTDEQMDYSRQQKPMLTMNRLYQMIKQIVGEQRQNTPQLQIRAATMKVPQQMLDLRENLTRKIAYDSSTEVVYQEAFMHALIGGWGAIQIATDYENDKSFNQCIKVEKVHDPLMAFWDPAAKLPHKGDGDYCGYYMQYTREEFKVLWPKVEYPQSFPLSTADTFSWGNNENITVACYWIKEYANKTIVQLSNGTESIVVEKKQALEIIEENAAQQRLFRLLNPLADISAIPTWTIVQERSVRDYKIMHYKLIYGEIIEKTEFAGKHLPIVFLDGDSFLIEGKQRTKSFVKFSIDSQRFLNYLASETADQIKKSHREQYIVTAKQIGNNDWVWRNPSQQSGALIYVPDPQAPPPEKQPPSELPQSLLMHYERADNDIKATSGIFEANLGQGGDEMSGVAIANRIKQGNTSSFIYFDNLNRAIQHVGKMILDLMPIIYDTERVVMTQEQNGDQEPVMINTYDEMGNPVNQMTDDEFTIMIEPGPSYALQKQQEMQTLIQLLQAAQNPAVFPLIADLLAENTDLENSPQLVERFKTLVPAQILAKENGEPPPPQQPNPAQQMQQLQMQAEIQKMKNEQQKLQNEQTELQLKARDLALKELQINNNAINDNNKLTLDKTRILLDEKNAVRKSNTELAKQAMQMGREIPVTYRNKKNKVNSVTSASAQSVSQ